MWIVVHLEGGIVQSVSSDKPIEAKVVIIDYDTEGADPKEIYKIPQSVDPFKTSDALVAFVDIGITDKNISNYLNSKEKK
jgi:hypothetical protein